MSPTNQSAAAPSYKPQVASTIRIAPQFINRLCARLDTAHSMQDGVSGLLFGASRDDVIEIQAFRSLIDTDVAEIKLGRLMLDDAVLDLAKAAARDPELAALDLIGWYSFRHDGGLRREDVAFHERRFPALSDIALTLRRSDGGFLVFEFYARDQEGRLTEKNHRWGASRFSPAQAVAGPVELALRARRERFRSEEATPEPVHENTTAVRSSRGPASILRTREVRYAPVSEVERPEQRVIATDDLPSVPAVIAPGPKRSGVPWFSSAILFALAAGVTFAILVLGGVPHLTSGSLWQALLPDSGLNLRVEGQGDRVLLSWNRRNSKVRAAAEGILHIDDGLQHRDVRLDGAQVENGAVLYRPNSDDVSFRLRIRDRNGATVVESLRILDSKAPSAPATDLSTSNTTKEAPSFPVETSHVWQPVSASVKSPPPQPVFRLQNSAPSQSKFDLSRLMAAPIPNPEKAAPVIPTPPSPVNSNQEEPSGRRTQSLETRDSNQQASLPRQSPPLPTPSPAQQAPGNSSPPTQSGRKVQPAAGGRYTPPKAVRQVLPDIAQLPSSIVSATGEIEIIVTVDQKGHVIGARVVEQRGRKMPHAMISAAVDAARQWRFEPARLDDQVVQSEHSIIFQFGGR